MRRALIDVDERDWNIFKIYLDFNDNEANSTQAQELEIYSKFHFRESVKPHGDVTR